MAEVNARVLCVGERVEVTWDGKTRQATLINRHPSGKYDVEFDVSRNSCSSFSFKSNNSPPPSVHFQPQTSCAVHTGVPTSSNKELDVSI